MIVERMTFNLKYGKEDESAAIWKEMIAHLTDVGSQRDLHARFYSCLSGRLCVSVQDLMLKSINDHNPMMYYWSINPRVQELYRQFTTLCDTSRRDMFKVECEVGDVQKASGMVCVRDTFQLFFGQAKDSIAIWKEILDGALGVGVPSVRMLTDVVGQSYTLVIESLYSRLNDFNPKIPFWNTNENLKSLHQKFIPLCENAERDFFQIEHDF
jgi:hypothetical protein